MTIPPLLAPLLALDRVTVIAHRGGALLRPENTMAAFVHAATLGVDALECDVRLSRDGEVVVIHDDTLDRTTDVSGPVAAYTADELGRVDAGYRFGEADGWPCRGAGIGVPRLREVLTRFPGLPVVVEIKGDDARIVGPVLDVIRSAGAAARVVVGGFSARVLAEARRGHDGLITSASTPEVLSALRRSYLFLRPRRGGFQLFQVPMRLQGKQVLTRGFVRAARRGRVPVQVWIVNEPDEMRQLMAWGASGLISDRPDLALAVVRGVAAASV